MGNAYDSYMNSRISKVDNYETIINVSRIISGLSLFVYIPIIVVFFFSPKTRVKVIQIQLIIASMFHNFTYFLQGTSTQEYLCITKGMVNLLPFFTTITTGTVIVYVALGIVWRPKEQEVTCGFFMKTFVFTWGIPLVYWLYNVWFYYFKQIEKFLNKDIEKLALPEGLGDGPKYEIKKGEKRNGSKSHNDKRRNSIRNSKHKAKTEEKSNKTSTQSDKSDANSEKTSDIKGKNNRRNNSKRDEKSKERKSKEKKQEIVKDDNTEQKDRTKKSEKNKKAARNNKSDKSETKSETQKNKEANKPKKKKRVNKSVTSHQEKVHKKSSKYAIPNDYPMPAKEESGIKLLLKKPLKWLKSLKK